MVTTGWTNELTDGQTERETDGCHSPASSCCVSYQCQLCRRCIIHDEARRAMLSAILLFILFLVLFLLLALLVLLLNLLILLLRLVLLILFLRFFLHVFLLRSVLVVQWMNRRTVNVLQVAVECTGRWQICFSASNGYEMDASRPPTVRASVAHSCTCRPRPYT